MNTVYLRRAGGVSAVAIVAALYASGQAAAGGFALKEGSASVQGASFAGATSRASDISYSFWNPAAMRETENVTVAFSASYISPDVDGTITSQLAGLPAVGSSVNGSEDAVVAANYAGFRLTEDVVLGLSIGAPFGLATEYEPGELGVAGVVARRSDLRSVEISPIISYDLNPNFTIAGGPTIVMGSLIFESSIGGGAQNLELETFGTAVGWQVGFLWDATPNTTFGAAYQSGYSLSSSGDSELYAGGNLVASGYGAFSADLPGLLSVGVTHSFGEFTVMAEAQWQQWSVFDNANITSVTGQSQEQFKYDDAFLIALGGEYQATQALTLRTGVAYDQTPSVDEERSARIPDQDRMWLSLGGSFQLTEHAKLDLAYSYLFGLEDTTARTQDNGAGTVLTTAEFEGQAHIFSLGGQIDF